MCGIVGIVGDAPVAGRLVDGGQRDGETVCPEHVPFLQMLHLQFVGVQKVYPFAQHVPQYLYLLIRNPDYIHFLLHSL